MAHENSKVDLEDARDLLLAILTKVQALNGVTVPEGRDRLQALAPIHRELLYLSHLAEKAKVAINDEYHRTRGYTEWTDGTIS